MILQAIVMALLGLVWHPNWEAFVLLEMPLSGLLIGPILDIVSDVADAVDQRNAARGLDKQLAEQEPLVLTSIDPADAWDPDLDEDGGPDPDDGERAPAAAEANDGQVISLDKYRKSA